MTSAKDSLSPSCLEPRAPRHGSARWNVLILPGGTEIGLELRQALMWCKEVSLYSAGASVSNHSPFAFRRHDIVPNVSEIGWVAALNNVIRARSITHILPGHDDVLLALAENASAIEAKVVSSPLETCRVTRSKTETLRLLRDLVPVPEIYDSPEKAPRFPVFVKPDRGQGAFNAARADNHSQLIGLLETDNSRIILEHLPGPEFTVDCFSDRERGLLYTGGRRRDRIRNGIAMASSFVVDPRFEDYARRIASRLELYGAWFYQVKMDDVGTLKLLEVAPRIGGTSALTRARGVNLPLLSLYECERVPVRVTSNAIGVEIDRALVNRFRLKLVYDTIYIDLDDTLLVHGQVNTNLLRLIFQTINRGGRIILLTRHSGDLDQTLRASRLHGIFDEIIHIKDGAPKHKFVKATGAIFIDDSFAERDAVARSTGVPVFDPSMVETLLDDRAGCCNGNESE